MFEWTSPAEGAFLSLAKGEPLALSDAERAFHVLSTVLTQSALTKYLGDAEASRFYPTDRYGARWASGQPTGWVDHYTAASSTKSTLRWFSSKPRPAGYGNSSAHVVIPPEGEIIIIVPILERVAYHATSANSWAIGVEHVNCGKFDTEDGKTFRYLDNKIAYEIDKERPPVFTKGSWWEPYATKQVLSNIVLKRLMCVLLPGLEQGKFTQHSVITPATKFDCGPMWPLETINNLAFSSVDLTKLSWVSTKYLNPPELREMVEESDAAILDIEKTEP